LLMFRGLSGRRVKHRAHAGSFHRYDARTG
jgi:hypothetical protein